MEITRREFLKTSSLAAATMGLAFPVLSSIPSNAATNTRTGGSGGFDYDTPDLQTPLAAFMHDRRSRAHVTAIGAAAIFDGQVVFERGYGIRNLKTGEPATIGTNFMQASVSKTVMAVAAMQAWERNLFELDQDLNDLLPFEVRNPRHPNVPVTPRMLLTHTSTIRDRWGVLTPLWVPGDSPISLDQILRDYLVPGGKYYAPHKTFSSKKPGTGYTYSNVGAALCGYLVETVTGIPFDKWCDDKIHKPLGMERASWHLAGMDQDRIAMPYRYVALTGKHVPRGFFGYPIYPVGQLRATPRAMATFLAMIASGGQTPGGPRVLEEETVDLMLTDQLRSLGLSWNQGLIWYRVRPRTNTGIWGHTGGDWGVTTHIFFRRSDGAGAVVLANGHAQSAHEGSALREIRDRLITQAHTFAS